MKRRTIYKGTQGLLLAASLLSTAVFAQAAGQQAAAWRATNNRVFNSATAQFQRGGGSSDPVSIAVTLNLNNKAALNDLIRRQHTSGDPSYHHWLSRTQSTQQFGPTQAQAQAVADYLTRNGFTNVKIAPNNLLVTADGTAELAQIAFNTQVGVYRNSKGRTGVANMMPIQVPAALSQVDQVLGLNTMTRMRTHFTSVPVTAAAGLGSGGANGYYPDEFATVYSRPSNLTAGNTTVALVGWGSMTNPVNNLVQFEAQRGIPAVPTSIISPNGSSSDDSEQGEWSMDAQAIVGISGGVQQLLFYTSGGTNGSGATTAALAPIINQVVTDNTAKVVNMSWSMPECGNGYGYFDSFFQIGAAQGQTFAAASGDNGAFPCPAGTPNGTYGDTSQLSVVYPASSPYVVAIGGSTLNTDSNLNYVYELGWPYSGGGVSSFEPIPDWQSINIAAITDIPSGSYREVPDLGFDADPNTGGVFYYTASADSGFTATGWAECPSGGGGYCLNGGTSMASPLFVGAWAVLETANNNTLGFAAPLIYTNFVGTGMAVKTIFVSDDDGNGYPSPYIGGMYNNVGGLGSINIAQMLTSIGLESTYTISASVNGTGGTIIPSESVFVVAYPGGVLPFRFTLNPKSGYSIASVGGTCGGTLSGNIYITNPVTANCTVVATFAPQ